MMASIIDDGVERKSGEPFIVPGFPEIPRVFHVATYKGEGDFQKGSSLDAFIGEGGLSAKSMLKPYGVAGYKGKTYVTDTAQSCVFVFDSVLKKVSFLGDTSPGKLSMPVGIALDGKGNAYVSDTRLKKIYVYDANGSVQRRSARDEFTARPVAINNHQLWSIPLGTCQSITLEKPVLPSENAVKRVNSITLPM
jgi:outer membrane protein assembly factor BamB